jgi:hypothetical protein
MDDPPDVNCRAKSYSAADHLINPSGQTMSDSGKRNPVPFRRSEVSSYGSSLHRGQNRPQMQIRGGPAGLVAGWRSVPLWFLFSGNPDSTEYPASE